MHGSCRGGTTGPGRRRIRCQDRLDGRGPHHDASRAAAAGTPAVNDVARGTSRTLFALEVRPAVPSALARLDDLASNLAYAWHPQIGALFERLDRDAWQAS